MMREQDRLGIGLTRSFGAEELIALRDDPATAIRAVVPEVTVHVQDAPVDSACGVEGMYHEPSRTITVQRARSERRTRFTALHEFGHDQARRDIDVARRLARASSDGGRRLEERIADAFAAEILIPEDIVVAVLGDKAPTAVAVADLFDHYGVGGSREACCVRAAQRMTGSGYVLLAEGNVIRFCATVGGAYAVRRGSRQPEGHLIVNAGDRGNAVSDHVRLRHPSGSETPEFSGQAVRLGNYVFAVLTDATSPPWGGWHPPRDRQARSAGAPELDCPDCDTVTEAWKRCDTDPTHRVCSSCGWCACRRPKAKVSEKQCDTCFLMRRVDLFPDGGTTCVDH